LQDAIAKRLNRHELSDRTGIREQNQTVR